MKDSAWEYIKDCGLFSVHFVIEIGLIPFHELNNVYKRAKNKMDKKQNNYHEYYYI
jgi:hypothetical protein